MISKEKERQLKQNMLAILRSSSMSEELKIDRMASLKLMFTIMEVDIMDSEAALGVIKRIEDEARAEVGMSKN